MSILVTGASGFVGRHLVASLRRSGKSVVALVRGGAASGPNEFSGPVDLAELDAWPAWPSVIDTVVHLAALNPSRRQPATVDALLNVNAAGTGALVRRARREGVRRIVFVSTANVHGPAPHPIRETDPLQPQSPYARSKAAAEEAFWRELQGSETQGCILRPAPVFGPGGRGNVATLAKLARLPIPLPIEGLGTKRSLLAVDHLVSAIELCLTADGAAAETFLIADDGPLTAAEMIRALRRGWSRRDGTIRLPRPMFDMLQSGSKAVPVLKSLFAPFVLDCGHLYDRTGWKPPLNGSDALSAAAARGEL